MDITPIGRVSSSRRDAVDDGWDSETSSVVLDRSELSPTALDGLDSFSHVEVVYLFDRVEPRRVERGARRPRGNEAWPEVGILAQRAKYRPNRIGLCRCRLIGVDAGTMTLHVRDLDAIDGTPVLDVKPWMAEFGPRGRVHQPAWASELMAGYWSRPGMTQT